MHIINSVQHLHQNKGSKGTFSVIHTNQIKQVIRTFLSPDYKNMTHRTKLLWYIDTDCLTTYNCHFKVPPKLSPYSVQHQQRATPSQKHLSDQTIQRNSFSDHTNQIKQFLRTLLIPDYKIMTNCTKLLWYIDTDCLTTYNYDFKVLPKPSPHSAQHLKRATPFLNPLSERRIQRNCFSDHTNQIEQLLRNFFSSDQKNMTNCTKLIWYIDTDCLTTYYYHFKVLPKPWPYCV